MAPADPITVSESVEEAARRKAAADLGTPAHWGDAKGSHFKNPWESFRPPTFSQQLFVLPKVAFALPKVSKDITSLVGLRKPTWGEDKAEDTREKIKATWLGHACFLVELPAAESQPRGLRLLFDPVFSHRCSPFQWMGPARFTPAPCEIEDIPEIDAIVISHNHYDHMDTHTLQTLFKRPRPPHVFAPLGNNDYFKSIHVPENLTHTLDWWSSRTVDVNLGGEKPAKMDITCTPCQHMTGRSLSDRFHTLWSSWAVKDVASGKQVYFAGDTAYRTVRDDEEEDKVPVCPAFKEIGQKFGSFDLAMIPIGAYLPRAFMSAVHCAPQDSVRVFKDINAKKAIGMHWGTWILTTEDVMDPPKEVKKECVKIGIPEDDFAISEIGQTLFFD